MDVNNDLGRAKRWLKGILNDDFDKYDIEARYDKKLSLEENKTIMRKQIKPLLKEWSRERFEQAKSEMAEAKARDDLVANERNKKEEQEIEEFNNTIKAEENKDPNRHYKDIHRAVSKVCQGFSNLAFIKGRCGIGKSHNIEKTLKEHKVDYIEITGEVTAAYLYRLLWEHNGKIIWCPDVVKILSEQKAMNLLKSATETKKERLLTKSTYSKEQEDLPDSFIYHGKLLFDYNHAPRSNLREDFEALISRGDFVEMVISGEEIAEIMRHIAKTDTEKEITEFLIKNFNSNGLFRLNLRTQNKAFKTYGWAMRNQLDWKEELATELKNVSEIRSLLYSLIGKTKVKRTELKKKLLKHQIVSSLRTADRKINEWLFIEELFKVSRDDRDYFVCINENPKQEIKAEFEV